MTTTATRYEPETLESKWMDRWLDAGVFHGQVDPDKEPYSIAIPPPNVTGALHMGHALNGSIQDALIRSKRMQGYSTLWMPGIDHAGIATQAVVEKQLRSEGISRHDLGREKFLERVWEWKEQYGDTIYSQFQRLGASLDYERNRFTMDEQYAKAVLQVFAHLYDRGYIYRDNYMVNWDPGSMSAISDLEVVQKDLTDEMVEVDYQLTSGDGHVTIATVRPETIPADVAIAVHPDDKRYAALVGQTVRVPFTERDVPIIADDYVDMEFGTGALKITPGHDQNDFEIGRRHQLDELAAIGYDGMMTDLAGAYAGLPADEARVKMTDALDEQGALRSREPYPHSVPHSERSGARIEPLISLQWFCDMSKLAGRAIDAVESGDVRFIPKTSENIFYSWMRNIKPWCLSRQLWWGHQLPVWYCASDGCDEIHVSVDGPGDSTCTGCNCADWVRDDDVLDTWFSSGLWDFATLGWPDETPELAYFHPTTVLSTAREIINLWVARMMMFSYEFLDERPFRDVYIHSVIQAPDGRRMSKSLGTGIDPIGMIEQYGADATRYGLLNVSSTQDVRFNEGRIQQGRELANKLWNASRLVRTQGDADALAQTTSDDIASLGAIDNLADAWIVARTVATAGELTELLEQYDFAMYTKRLYAFVWSEYCDWYLEASKRALRDEGGQREQTTRILGWVLDAILRLTHPIMPHVTEEIADQTWPQRDGFLVDQAWPVYDDVSLGWDGDPISDFEQVRDMVVRIRSLRDAAGVAPRAIVPVQVAGGPDARFSAIVTGMEAIRDLARIEIADDVATGVLVPVGDSSIRLGGLDTALLAERVTADLREAQSELKRAQGKLGNERFTSKAPAELVEEERAKVAQFTSRIDELTALQAELADA